MLTTICGHVRRAALTFPRSSASRLPLLPYVVLVNMFGPAHSVGCRGVLQIPDAKRLGASLNATSIFNSLAQFEATRTLIFTNIETQSPGPYSKRGPEAYFVAASTRVRESLYPTRHTCCVFRLRGIVLDLSRIWCMNTVIFSSTLLSRPPNARRFDRVNAWGSTRAAPESRNLFAV